MPLTPLSSDPLLTRTCEANLAHAEALTLPLTEENFFHRRRADGRLYIETRCQACRRVRDREVRRLRAAGTPVRAARRTRGGRQFGVEIEFIGTATVRDNLIAEMRLRGVAVAYEGYTHAVRRGVWKIVRDASVSGGWELVSPPIRGEAGMAELERACEALAAAGATVNRACGLHVHHDLAGLDAASIGRLARGWSNNQRNTNDLVAASRRSSQWAQPLTSRDVVRVEALRSTDRDSVRRHFNSYVIDRYRSLNFASFPRYGTVEVRQHQGTTNFRKIAAWIVYGQAFVAAAVAGPIAAAASTADLLSDFASAGHLTSEQAEYLTARAAHFGGSRVGAVA